MTFPEFRKNNPSITKPFEIKKHSIMLIDERGKRRPFRNYFWGICQGDSVFVYLNNLTLTDEPELFPIKSLGRFCYFSKTVKRFKPGSLEQVSYRTTIINRGVAYMDLMEGIVDINTGESYILDETVMKDLLRNDPDLLQRYLQERDKVGVFKKYIIQYNELHRQDIKQP